MRDKESGMTCCGLHALKPETFLAIGTWLSGYALLRRYGISSVPQFLNLSTVFRHYHIYHPQFLFVVS